MLSSDPRSPHIQVMMIHADTNVNFSAHKVEELNFGPKILKYKESMKSLKWRCSRISKRSKSAGKVKCSEYHHFVHSLCLFRHIQKIGVNIQSFVSLTIKKLTFDPVCDDTILTKNGLLCSSNAVK